MRKILAGLIANGKTGGVDKYLLGVQETAQKEQVQMDFLTNEVDAGLQTYLAGAGSRLYAVSTLHHPVRQFQEVCAILRAGNYDAIYLNISTAIECVAILAAKHVGIQERIIHSHSSGNDRENPLKRTLYNVLHHVCKLWLYKGGTRFYACSKKAGYWMFPRKIVESSKFEVIFNAVDREHFAYDPELRTKVRKEMGLEKRFVMGHVGNFCYAKNYPFLIRTFQEVKKRKKEAVLLLAGTGREKEKVQAMVHRMGLDDSVRFLGWCPDTAKLYHAMDVFVLPSRFEGLPIVGVEAQCTKVRCILSASITPEARIQDHCFFKELKEGPVKWAEAIIEEQPYHRGEVHMLKQAAQYDLAVQEEQLKGIVCH